MEECGDGSCDAIVKTDQEPSIGILVKDLVEMRGNEKGGRTVVENSPVGSSKSNGLVERGVQAVEGQIRVLKSALEGRLGMKVHAERRVVKFMAEYGAYLLNRLEVGKDGKTAYERVKGKKRGSEMRKRGRRNLKREGKLRERRDPREESQRVVLGMDGGKELREQEGILRILSLRRRKKRWKSGGLMFKHGTSFMGRQIGEFGGRI